jgi:hypothetical protein
VRRVEHGSADQVGAYPCKIVTLFSDERKVQEFCLTDAGEADLKEAMEAIHALSRFGESLMKVAENTPFGNMFKFPFEEAHQMDADTAEKYIREVDEARSRWVRGVYGKDILDPTNYDLVLNLGTFTVAEACSIVATAAGQPEFSGGPSRREELKDFRIASQAQLALADDMGTQTLELEATAKGGVVEVYGQAPILNTGEVGSRIIEIVNSIEGVKDVVLKIEWFDPYP